MTAQVSDQFVLHRNVYAIAGVKGNSLFDPSSLGIQPFSTISGCWNGYLCQYTVKQGHLVLDKLQLSLGYYTEPNAPLKVQRQLQPIEGPAINGVKPATRTKSFWDAPKNVKSQIILGMIDFRYALFNNVYENLSL